MRLDRPVAGYTRPPKFNLAQLEALDALRRALGAYSAAKRELRAKDVSRVRAQTLAENHKEAELAVVAARRALEETLLDSVDA